MPRDLPIGNGSLLVSFDASYSLRDIYFPWVGLENHTAGARCRTGVWVDGQFAWLSDQSWRKRLHYQAETLVTDVLAQNDYMALRLNVNDAVDMNRDLLLRKFTITNLEHFDREVRLFFHYDYHIYGLGVGDTIHYDPEQRGLIAYKGRRYFLMNGAVPGGHGATSWATGQKEFFGREGTWRDAEDGELSRNPIAQGSVDAVIALHTTVPAQGQVTVYHWLAAGRTGEEVKELDDIVRDRGPEALLHRTAGFWRGWVNKEDLPFDSLPPGLTDLYKRSLLIMRTNADNGGALIASTDWDATEFNRDTYCYMWPRDGALVTMALDAAGYADLTQRFFNFCGNAISPGGYLMHKFGPTGEVGSSWHPWIDQNGQPQLAIQEDETGLVLMSLWQHYQKWRDIEFVRPLYHKLISRAAQFMISFREPNTGLPAASYDLWEERHGIHAFTIAAVWAGLQAAASFADVFSDTALAQQCRETAKEIKLATTRLLFDRSRGHFVRMVRILPDGALECDPTLDASVSAFARFGMYSPHDPMVASTMAAIEERLWCRTPVGGLARYEHDPYFLADADRGRVPGNPWFICTLWLAQYHIARARQPEDLDTALRFLEWVEGHAFPSGVLAEQIHPGTGAPLSVSPLTWSHGELVLTVHQYLTRLRALHRRSRADRRTQVIARP